MLPGVDNNIVNMVVDRSIPNGITTVLCPITHSTTLYGELCIIQWINIIDHNFFHSDNAMYMHWKMCNYFILFILLNVHMGLICSTPGRLSASCHFALMLHKEAAFPCMANMVCLMYCQKISGMHTSIEIFTWNPLSVYFRLIQEELLFIQSVTLSSYLIYSTDISDPIKRYNDYIFKLMFGRN